MIVTHGPGGYWAISNIRLLAERRLRICTGIRDAWSPLNTPDMLERVYIVCYRNGLRRDDWIEDVTRIATEGAAGVMKADGYGLGEGADADLVLVDGETHVEAVISRPARHLVMKRGRIVARAGEALVQ